jgi:hypothetical protein
MSNKKCYCQFVGEMDKKKNVFPDCAEKATLGDGSPCIPVYLRSSLEKEGGTQ